MSKYEIITIDNNQSFVTVNTLVKFSGNSEKQVKELASDYVDKLEELCVRVQTERETVGFERYTEGFNRGKIIWSKAKFNEAQAGFLLSLMQNTKQIVDFKFKLQVEIQRFKKERENCKPQLSFNQHKMQMISDVAQKAIDSINALEDDTKQIEAPVTVETIQDNTRSTMSHNTESKYYKLPRTNLRDLPLDDPIEGLICFEYYNDTDCIIYSAKRNKTYKICTPPWMKELGTWSFVKAHIKFIRTPKTGKFALISIKEKR